MLCSGSRLQQRFKTSLDVCQSCISVPLMSLQPVCRCVDVLNFLLIARPSVSKVDFIYILMIILTVNNSHYMSRSVKQFYFFWKFSQMFDSVNVRFERWGGDRGAPYAAEIIRFYPSRMHNQVKPQKRSDFLKRRRRRINTEIPGTFLLDHILSIIGIV